MAAPIETVIYLDIDGVLNVGIGDHGNTAPLLLNDVNRRMAAEVKDVSLLAPQEREYVEKLMSVCGRPVGNTENGTYMNYMCSGAEQFAAPLLARLAHIIRSADDPFVVLASNWRKPKYKNKVRGLEEAISRHLGAKFAFDGTTPVINEKGAVDRIKCIGEHVKAFCTDPDRSGAARVLVVDDFFVTRLDGWSVDGSRMHSVADVENYLKRCAETPDVNVKLVHCYTEWTTNGGLKVEIGTGLTADHTRSALEFLESTSHMISETPTGDGRWASPVASLPISLPETRPSSRVDRMRSLLSRAMPMPKRASTKAKTAIAKLVSTDSG